jgi:hypothetical protein
VTGSLYDVEMNAPTERNLAFAKQAATTAAFRVLLVFLLFGFVELLEAAGRGAVTMLTSPGVLAHPRSFGPDLSSRWQLAFVVQTILFSVVKLGILVVMFRRRVSLVPSLTLFVVLGVAGAAARLASYGVTAYMVLPGLVTGPSEAVAEWSMASTFAGTVSFVLDTLMLLGVFVAAALAMTRDRVPLEKPPTYRRAPAD